MHAGLGRFRIAPWLAVAWAVAATVPASPAGVPHVLTYATAEDVATLNPILNTQTVVSYLTQMTGAYCFRYDRAGRLIPELVTVVPTIANHGIGADGKTVVLKFRRNARWSDGKPFDADDFIFTVEKIDDPKTNVPSRDGFDRIVKIDEPDKFTAIVHLRTPYGSILQQLFSGGASFAMLPKHAFAGVTDMNTAPFNALPIGIGPFRYAAWRRGDAIELERNPYYWRGRAALDRVVMKLIPDRNTVLAQMQTGELDLWYPFGGSYLARVAAIPAVRVIRRPGYSVNIIAFNVTRPSVADGAVRTAIRYAIDRRVLRDKIGHGVGVLQDVLVPTVDPIAPRDVPFTPADPGKANAVLEAAGWKRGPDGVRMKAGTRLSLDMASSVGAPDVDSVIELMRANLQAVGIDLQVRRYESSMLFAPYDAGGIFLTGKFDVLFLGFTYSSPPDIANLFACDERPPAGRNAFRYCNPAFDAVARRYDATYDDATRASALDAASRILETDVPAIAATWREDLFAVNRRVVNFDPPAASPFDDMLRVDVR